MEQLVIWVKKLAVFMIIAAYMEQILPANYQKYFHMCTGSMLILMITSPIIQYISGTSSVDLRYMIENLKLNSRLYQTEKLPSEEFKNYYLTYYEDMLKERIRQLADDCGMTLEAITLDIEEDAEKEDYGQIKQLSLQFMHKDENIQKVKQLKELLKKQLNVSENALTIRE